MRTLRVIAMGIALSLVACGGGSGDGDDGDDDGDDSDGGNGGDGDGGVDVDAPAGDVNFSFFVTSLETMRAQSGSQDGFGGDLGGLAGADAICETAAANVGFGHKTWHAYLSTYNNGSPINAIDRIGEGPWYDRNARLVATNKAGLMSGNRPAGDAATINDLPDEFGIPGTSLGDTHDIMTATNTQGRFDGSSAAASCQDWTSAVGPGSEERVRVGHSWPAGSGQHWATAHRMRGCSPGVNLVQNGPGNGDCVGCGGGWGAIYCFAMEP